MWGTLLKTMSEVVLIDDHPVFMEGMRGLLSGLPSIATVDVFETVDDFLEHFEEASQPRLILLDLYFFGTPCWDGLTQLLEMPGSLRVGVVSASEDPADVRSVFEKGAIGFIPKSATAEVIQHAVQILLDGGTYVPIGAIQSASANDVRLTERQIDVLRVTARGLTNKEIAAELGLSVSTVKVHLNAIMRILNVRNRTELANLDHVRRLS